MGEATNYQHHDPCTSKNRVSRSHSRNHYFQNQHAAPKLHRFVSAKNQFMASPKDLPKGVLFRTWNKDDIPILARLTYDLYRYIETLDTIWRTSPHAIDHLRAHLYELHTRRHTMTYVASLDKELIGFITGSIMQRPPVVLPLRDGLIDNAYVKPTWRGKGIGTHLTHMMLDWFRLQGVAEVRIHYQISNKGAKAFWERIGFRPWTVQAHLWLSDKNV